MPTHSKQPEQNRTELSSSGWWMEKHILELFERYTDNICRGQGSCAAHLLDLLAEDGHHEIKTKKLQLTDTLLLFGWRK